MALEKAWVYVNPCCTRCGTGFSIPTQDPAKPPLAFTSWVRQEHTLTCAVCALVARVSWDLGFYTRLR